MKRFASHYLFLPGAGYLKQQVVEVTDEGTVQRVFPLEEEVESVEWLPGVIALLTESEIAGLENNECISEIEYIFSLDLPHKPIESPLSSFQKESGDTLVFKEKLFPCLFYPFDFTSMQPVAGTRHRLLR